MIVVTVIMLIIMIIMVIIVSKLKLEIANTRVNAAVLSKN